MATDDYGVNFAPTGDNAAMAGRRSQIEGVPQAIKILSLRLPRFLGTKGLAPDELLTAQGARGDDPFSAVMQSLMSTLAPEGLGSLPEVGVEGFAGLGGNISRPRIIPGYQPTETDGGPIETSESLPEEGGISGTMRLSRLRSDVGRRPFPQGGRPRIE